MKFAEVRNDDSGITWISGKWNESDWPVRFVLKLEYSDYWSEEMAKDIGKYMISVWAIAPQALVDAGNLESTLATIGMTVERFDSLNCRSQAEVLADLSAGARLYYKSGNNKHKLVRDARKEMRAITFMFGFYMNRPINAIGATGWDFIRGNSLGSRHKTQVQS
jgi:hypothetical protein